MFNAFFKNYVYPVATLASSIIGVGFLSLPYIALKIGTWPMVFYFIVLTFLVILLHVIFGEIALRTPDFKRWPGFVGFYLGTWPRRIITVTMTAGIFGVMLVYLIIGSQFLFVVFNPFLGGSALTYIFIYFVAGAVCIYFGVKTISKIDFLALLLLLVILMVTFAEGFSYIHAGNLFLEISNFKQNFFLPYGALLFSLWGAGFIPETEEMVRDHKKSLKKIIIISMVIPAVFYFVFTFLIVSITGSATTESALVGLRGFLGSGPMVVALFMGVITTFIAFIAQGLLLKKIFVYDMGISELPAWALVCGVPLVLLLSGFNSFIFLISFIGGVLLSIDGILILLMYRKIGGKKIIVYPLVLFFILGVIYELIYFTK